MFEPIITRPNLIIGQFVIWTGSTNDLITSWEPGDWFGAMFDSDSSLT